MSEAHGGRVLLKGNGGKRINQRTGMKTLKINTKTYFFKKKTM